MYEHVSKNASKHRVCHQISRQGYIVMADTVMADIVMADIVMAYIVMVYLVMVYLVRVKLVMAQGVLQKHEGRTLLLLRRTYLQSPCLSTFLSTF